MTNIKALRKRIDNSGLSYTFVARKAGILRETLYNRMKTGDFKLSEICALSDVLSLTRDERDSIFFADDGELKSAKTERR